MSMQARRRRAPDDLDADPQEVARTIALRLLDARPRTRRELEQAMDRRNVPEDAAAAVLDRLTEVGLVDDAAFATAWVDSRHAGRGLGRRALSAELHRKGVDPQLAAGALEGVTADDEAAVARALVERRLRSMQSLDATTKQRRLIGLLARKGIAPGVAAGVVRAALDAAVDAEL